MPATPAPETELAQLNREIERLETEQALLEDQRKKRSKVVGRAAWPCRYLRLARALRAPSAKWEWWRIGVIVVGPVAFGVLLFVLVDLVADSFSLALLGFLFGAAAGAGGLASLFYRPTDALLPAALAEAESQSRVASAHWKEAFERLTEVKQQLARLVEDRRARMASGRVQRAALLQRPWKGMSGVEWEDFVVEVCRTLGATVDRRGHGDEGAELIVDFGSRRVAVLVKTAREAIDSGSVRKAIEVMHRERCETCAIISNGRFTGAAQDFAPRNGCKLIGREEFPDFVIGKAELQ